MKVGRASRRNWKSQVTGEEPKRSGSEGGEKAIIFKLGLSMEEGRPTKNKFGSGKSQWFSKYFNLKW